MSEIKEDVVKLLDDELMEYIVEDTKHLILKFENQILNGNYKVLGEFDGLFEKVQNVIELLFKYIGNTKKTIPCDVASLLIYITELKSTIYNCKHKFNEVDDFFDEPKIVGDLRQYIDDTLSGYYLERKNHFTKEDITNYINKRESEIEEHKSYFKQNKEKNKKYIADNKDKIEQWRKENLNKNFDTGVLSEEEIKILKAGLETDLKSISTSWIQRRFAMGYIKAIKIIEHLEDCGAISRLKDVEALGLSKLERIIRVYPL